MAATIERTIELLKMLAIEDGGYTISDVAANLNTSLASASRMVRTLRDANAVSRDEKTGRIFASVEMWTLGAAALKRMEFRRIAAPVIAAVVLETGRPINLTVPGTDTAISIETYDVSGRFVMTTPVGKPTAYHAATNGKAILAFLPEEQAERILSRPLARFTDTTITDRAKLEKELESIRRRSVAMNRQESRPGTLAVAVPLLDSSGMAIAGLSTPCTEEDLNPDSRPARMLTNLVRSISAQLGYTEDAHEAFA